MPIFLYFFNFTYNFECSTCTFEYFYRGFITFISAKELRTSSITDSRPHLIVSSISGFFSSNFSETFLYYYIKLRRLWCHPEQRLLGNDSHSNHLHVCVLQQALLFDKALTSWQLAVAVWCVSHRFLALNPENSEFQQSNEKCKRPSDGERKTWFSWCCSLTVIPPQFLSAGLTCC